MIFLKVSLFFSVCLGIPVTENEESIERSEQFSTTTQINLESSFTSTLSFSSSFFDFVTTDSPCADSWAWFYSMVYSNENCEEEPRLSEWGSTTVIPPTRKPMDDVTIYHRIMALFENLTPTSQLKMAN
jgi:hypothetical protein